MAIKEYVINAVAAAVAVGAGTSIISDKLKLARHDERIMRLETLNASVDGLREDLQSVDKKLERVDAKLEAMEAPK